MNRDDVLQMAIEVWGLSAVLRPDEHVDGVGGIYIHSDENCLRELERFAALVESATLRTAIAEAEEPVAWYHPSGEGYDSAFRDHSTVVTCDGGDWSEWIPLYTHPPRREPLTEEAISDIVRECVKSGLLLMERESVKWACRAVERAHGIGTDV